MQDSPQQTDAPQGDPPHGVPTGRAMHIMYICAITAVLIGLYFGIRYEPQSIASLQTQHDDNTAAHTPAMHGVQPATPYWDIHRGSLSPNAHWHAQLDTNIVAQTHWQNSDPPSDGDKQRDLALRASRRAYNGAPPTIPHRVDPLDVTSCTSCHGTTGMRIGDVVARPMPHIAYASCTQCHVPQQSLEESELPWLINDFEGLPAPTHGERAWEGAPPTIPHTTAMRSNCMSCHGPNGLSGLQSTHPWRNSCTQCHAPSAQLDRQPGALDPGDLFLPNDLPTLPESDP